MYGAPSRAEGHRTSSRVMSRVWPRSPGCPPERRQACSGWTRRRPPRCCSTTASNLSPRFVGAVKHGNSTLRSAANPIAGQGCVDSDAQRSDKDANAAEEGTRGTPHHHLGARTEAAEDKSLVPHHPSLTWKTEQAESIHRSWNQRWGLGEIAAARAVYTASRPGDRGFQAIEPTWTPGRFIRAFMGLYESGRVGLEATG